MSDSVLSRMNDKKTRRSGAPLTRSFSGGFWMKKGGIIVLAALAVLLVSCASTGGGSADENAIARGVKAWNNREPAAAAAYWNDIENNNVKKKYQNYITLYNAGVAALSRADSTRSSHKAKLLAVCNTALGKFLALDPALKLPPDICQKGAVLSAGCISAQLAVEKLSAAKRLYASALKVYGDSDELSFAGREIDMVSSIISKKSALSSRADKAREIDSFDDKIAAYDATLSAYAAAKNEIVSTVAKSDVAKSAGVAANVRSFRKASQDLSIERESAIRERAYNYKDRIGEEFARTAEQGKDGKMSLEEILAHYQSVKTNIDTIYQELLEFAARYPNDIGKDVLDDIGSQKKDLENKIAQVNAEIRTAKEIASRGKVVMPLMIGLFNTAPGSTAETKKSRPAKFSAKKARKNEYWWGMVSIPRNQMNDLVITLKDNRTVRVFSENTKSGKLIKRNNMKDLVNRGYKVGNSWPVLNAGSQLSSNKYFFEVQKGKTADYAGEVVVYSSFIVRMR
jgi:hypothetical protein